MSAVSDGERCQDIEYGVSPLALDGSTYFWRIRFWDDEDNVSPWSTETAYFTMVKKEEVVVPPERGNPVDAVGKVKKARVPLLGRRRQLTWSRLITSPTRVILDP